MKNRLIRPISFIIILWMVVSACGFLGQASTPVANPTATLKAAVIEPATPAPTATRAATPTATQAANPTPTQGNPPAPEGGPKIVTGQVLYSNPFFTAGVAEPEVILEDQGGFVTRDRKFVIPIESQVIGQITSDFYTSPFSYTLSLPAQPNGTLHDVDHDGEQDQGVMVFAVAYWTNTWGDPFLERRDQGGGGWSSAYASTKVSDNRDNYLEVFGGKYLVYAPDDSQQFSSGFGPDQKLFTDDDPIVNLQAGWSVIDLDQTPFTISRDEFPTIDLIEPESTALDDFSTDSYTQAFDQMIDKFKKEYAFTELKQIDWDAKAAEFRPRFAQAETNQDAHAYALALRDFFWSIPDAHVGMDTSSLNDDFQTDTAGGLGFAISETDDGKMIATYILQNGPADEAGMQWGAEITSLDGQPTNQVVEAAVPWSSPFSNPIVKRLQQLRYATRFKLDKGEVEVIFKNPGGSEQTARLPVVDERDSFNATSFRANQSPTALPVEYEILPSRYGYIKITSFLDNDVLSIQLWERAIRFFKDNNVPGVILDLRVNGGGSGWLASQMAAYFFDKETVVGNTAYYNQGSGSFYMDPGDQTRMIPPTPDLQYSGSVDVLVGPACASACEFFSYNMTIDNRATVVGQYPTDGAGGSVEQFVMPEGIYCQFTIGRAVDPQGDIHLEGKGVAPDVKVPVNADTLQRQANGEDVVLQAAVEDLSKPKGAGITPSGPPKVATVSDAQAALQAGTPFLEEKALETHDPAVFAAPGTVTSTIPLQASEPLIWAYVWCAKDTATLDQNFENIKAKFILDGTDVTGEMASFDAQPNGQSCHILFTSLTDWPAGEHHLSITATFTNQINDGTADYAAGDYILEYTVYVKP